MCVCVSVQRAYWLVCWVNARILALRQCDTISHMTIEALHNLCIDFGGDQKCIESNVIETFLQRAHTQKAGARCGAESGTFTGIVSGISFISTSVVPVSVSKRFSFVGCRIRIAGRLEECHSDGRRPNTTSL